MKRPHHVIYLPGLGDDTFEWIQTRLLKAWRIYGLRTHYHYIGWGDGEAFAPKLERILAAIDEYGKDGTVSLIGTSAGASAALDAFALRKGEIHSVVCICGKLRNPQTIRKARFKQNPAFKDSLMLLPDSLDALNRDDREKIWSARPLSDGTVPPSDTFVDGAHTVLLPTSGHSASIFYALTFGSFKLARLLKR